MKISTLFFFASFLILSCHNADLIRINDSKIDYDYSVDQDYCPHPICWPTARVFVKSDSICAVVILESVTYRPYSDWKYYRTIKGLLNAIATNDTTRYSLKVSMDTLYHYPASLVFIEKPNREYISDVSWSYFTKNYRLK